MAFPYSSGEVLTAADLNQSSGLVLVKSQTIGSGVSSVTVTDAFSATFDHYLVTVRYDSASVNAVMSVRLDGSTSNYKWSYVRTAWNATVSGNGNGSATEVGFAGGQVTTGASYAIPIHGPFLAEATTFGPIAWVDSGSGACTVGLHTNATSYTGFVISPSAGTISGGAIRVYGYNNG